MILKFLFVFILIFSLIGCDSKVVTTEDTQLSEEAQKNVDPDSAFEILENNAKTAQISCSPKNSLRILVTQNKKSLWLCKDQTRLDANLTPGPVCAGGVTLAPFTTSGEWVPCEQVTVCGKAATTVIDLKSTSMAQLRQLQFSNLPWGCKGTIDIKEQTSGTELSPVPVAIEAPECPTCAITNTKTCLECGNDVVAPEIIDVFTESFQCNKIRVLVFANDANAGIHENGYSFDGGLTWQADSIKDFTGLTYSSPANSVWVRDRSGNIAKYTKALSATSSPCPCATPWGETIQHGTTLKAFKSTTVACTTTCEANSTSRTCNNGVLSGGAEFVAGTCSVVGCPKCRLPWGDEIDHGISVKAFNRSSAPCAGECLESTLSCDRGNLVGDSATYKAKACSFVKPSCDCQHAGSVLKNGQNRTVFSSAEVPCGSSCQSGTVTCSSGTLTGSTNYNNLGCSPKICKCTTAWGQQIDLNIVVDAYKASTVSCSQNTTCEAATNKIRIQCADVINNRFQLVESTTGNIPDFKQPGCSPEVCGCTHLGVVFKPTDPPLKVYKIAEATPPAKCALNGNSGEVRCTGTSPNFTLAGDTNTSIFKYTQCKDLSVPGIGTGTGESPLNVGVGTGGGAGGGIGNGEGDGEGFRRNFVGPGAGSGCDVNKPPYICWGAGGGVTTTSSFCLLPGNDGYNNAETNSMDFRHRISPGGAIPAYSQKTVACGDSCSKYMGMISCDHGVMSEKTKYRFLNCSETCP